MKNLLAAFLLAFSVTSASATNLTPTSTDCNHPFGWAEDLGKGGFSPMMIFNDKFDPDWKEMMLFNSKEHTVVLIAGNQKQGKTCLLFYGDGNTIIPDPNVFRDFLQLTEDKSKAGASNQ